MAKVASAAQDAVYRLVLLDVDGTLLRPDRRISRRTREVIDRLREAGVRVGLATGRSWPEVGFIARELAIDLPLICLNGAQICDPQTGEWKRHCTMDPEVNLALTQVLKQKRLWFFHYVEHQMVMEKQARRRVVGNGFRKLRRLLDLKRAFNWFRELRHWEVATVDDVVAYFRDTGLAPTNITIELGDSRSVYDELVREFGDQAEISLTHQNPYVVDVMPKGVTKASGLRYVAERLGIPLEQVVAAGDGGNDIEMLQMAGLGIAMGNALPPVKKAADVVVGPHDADGLAEALERYVLQPSAVGVGR